jgi:hypothetical protein
VKAVGVVTEVDGDAVAHFAAQGWLLTRTLDAVGAAQVRAWVDEVEGWPDTDDKWLHYREMTDAGPRLCRTENFVPHHDGLRAFLTTGTMVAIAGALLGEPAVLYKEKINYKLPGGAGYSPHQDAPAYPFVATHVSCMVAVDDATVGNGCLEVVTACHAEVLPVDADGCIAAEVAAELAWEPVPVRAGETLWFHSRTPHRSGPNDSARPRRALYPTYNAAAEGDLRTDYYRRKLAALADRPADGDRVAVSLIGDFQGRPVT